jgi:hypothetical protein
LLLLNKFGFNCQSLLDVGTGSTPAGVTDAEPGNLFGCGITPAAVAEFNGDTTFGPFEPGN